MSYHLTVNIKCKVLASQINDLYYEGELWCITGDSGQCIDVAGWDYSGDYIWPDTNTLYIVGMFLCYNGTLGEKLS